MKRGKLAAAIVLLLAGSIIVAGAWYLRSPSQPPAPPSAPSPAIPTTLPLPSGTTFPLIPRTLPNGTTEYSRSFPTNLTGSCQLIEGSWTASANTVTDEDRGRNGSLHLFSLPLGTLYNGSLAFESWVPDTVRVVQTIQATVRDPCDAPVTTPSWSVSNSGNMCSSPPPYPPYELVYSFQLRNTAAVNESATLDFYFTYFGNGGTQYLLEQRDTYVVGAGATANLTNPITYFDCPGGVGGNANLAITNVWPTSP